MGLKRNIFIIFIIILLTPLSLSADVWQRVEGVYSEVKVELLINYQNELYIQSRIPKQNIFTKTEDKWNPVTDNFLSTLGKIYSYKQINNISFVSSANGNFRSYDNGETWEIIDPLYLENIAIADSTVFGQSQSTKEKLYKLVPNSTKWEPVTFINDENEIDTVIGDVLMAKGNIVLVGENAKITKSAGLYISLNYGNSWYKSNTFSGNINSLEVHNDVIFIGADDKHLYRSFDNGETWVVDTSKIMPIDNFISSDIGLIAAVNLDASLNNGESGIHLSKDNGESWEKMDLGIGYKTIYQFEEVNNEIYALDNKSFVYHYSKSSNIWNVEEILYDSLPCYDIILHDDTLYTIGWQRGVLYSTDTGVNWTILNDNLDEQDISFSRLKKNNKNFILDKNGYYILLSSNSGKSWNSYSPPGYQGSPPINDILLIDDRVLIGTGLGLIYSNDYGENWNQLYGGELDSGVFTSLLRTDGNTMYVFSSKGLLKSTDKGIMWELALGIDEFLKRSIYYYDIIDGEIYNLNDSSEIIKYNFNTKKETLFFKSPVKNINPGKLIKYDDYFIVILKDMIFVSNDDGENWNSFSLVSENQKTVPDRIRNVVPYKDYLIAATDYGIWRAKLSDLGIEVKSTVESEIERNYLYTYPPYPNPAKSEVKVLFYWDINIPMTTDDISIYDITGKKIDAVDNISLVKQESHYGNIIWDCSSVEPGVYLINIKHGTEEKALKVVVE